MRYTIYIMLNAEDDFRKEELEIPEEISSIQAFYLYLKKKCKLPDLRKEEIYICSKDKYEMVTLFITSQGDTISYEPIDMKILLSINTLYLSYCNRTARAEEIFLSNGGSHYYMWHDGWEQEYSKYEISKKQEKEWLQKHNLHPRIP
ncbi:hypothetical protein DW228_20245 [Bacteroides fragilis]|uniref:Uncharacterized protein n=1 Tax=Bacteroides fragilis TaxID=817 RepID=A0A396BTB0_BACFG|nr:hypothetical protein [Bacteroides fragilis]RHH06983.1 hypothetical protein DW228_20245 [Bacteroides fragilis]